LPVAELKAGRSARTFKNAKGHQQMALSPGGDIDYVTGNITTLL